MNADEDPPKAHDKRVYEGEPADPPLLIKHHEGGGDGEPDGGVQGGQRRGGENCRRVGEQVDCIAEARRFQERTGTQ